MSALYAKTSGTGPPLVLLHGWGMNLRVFDPLREALAAQFTVTALDLPGHGRSPWPESLSGAQLLAQLATQLPPDSTLVGWSLGGQLALQLAADPALAVQRLVLIASTPRFVRSPDWAHGLADQTVLDFAAQLARDPERTVDSFLELQVRGGAAAGAVLTSLTRALREQGGAQPAALRFGLGLLQHNDLRALASRLPVPALVIGGEYDRVTPPQAAQALARLLPRAALRVLRRAGHVPFLSHREEVLAAMLEFAAERQDSAL
jgi:pimeloyl-[acyl-carrier protein] methyl ester esterase